MDDGIELNFAPSAAGPSRIQQSKKKSGGSWTDRLKANKAAKQRTGGGGAVKGATGPGGGAPLPLSASKSTSTTTASSARRENATPSVGSGPATAAQPIQRQAEVPTIPNSPSNRTTFTPAAPNETINSRPGPSKPSTFIPKPRSTQVNPSSSTGPASSSHQIISSLFSSNPTIPRTKPTESTTEIDDDSLKNAANPSNAPIDTSTFEGLGLDPLLVHHLKSKLNIQKPTRIQRSALHSLLDPTPLTLGIPSTESYSPAIYPLSITAQSNRDAFIQSQTGSGKTLSYLLPIVQSLLPLASRKGQFIDRSVGTLAIILAPTRELARQISEVVDDLLRLGLSLPAEDSTIKDQVKIEGEGDQSQPEKDQAEPPHRPQIYQRYLVSGLLTGGSTRTHEKSRLRRGCPILVCTPGRLLDHLQNTQSFKVDKLMWLVLDEADRLVEEGFGETLQGIMRALEGRRKIGMEAEREGLESGNGGGRRKDVKVKQVVGKSYGGKIKIEGFDDDSDEDDDEDDDWDYETMGAKPRTSKTTPSNNASAASNIDNQPTSSTSLSLPRSSNTLSVSSSSWPYWHIGRRTILCSATVSGEVQQLAGTTLKNPIMFRGTDIPDDDGDSNNEITHGGEAGVVIPAKKNKKEDSGNKDDIGEDEKFTPPSQLDQRYIIVPPKLRLVTLIALLRSLIAKATATQTGMKVIVFMSCTDSVDFHWKMFGGVKMGGGGAEGTEGEHGSGSGPKEEIQQEEEKIGYNCPLLPSTSIFRLHGSLPLSTRRSSLSAFASSSMTNNKSLPIELVKNTHSILLCTSVASRGLDLPLVRAVVQYDLPTEQGVNEYVHRVGRTARVGKGGESWAFVGDKEAGWVGWVEDGMNKSGKDKADQGSGSKKHNKSKGDQGKSEEDTAVALRSVSVEDVLKRGFVPKGGVLKYDREYEGRATQVQLAFERWVLENDTNTSLARRAFSSSIRAYSTHPSEEKQFFHVKNLHLGHVAKAFGLRETPGKIGGGSGAGDGKAGKDGKKKDKVSTVVMEKERGISGGNKAKLGLKRKRGGQDHDEDDDNDSESDSPTDSPNNKKKPAHVPKARGASSALTETERRMYSAVRRQGRLTKSDGKMGMSVGGGGEGRNRVRVDGGEFQVVGGAERGGELERMVRRKY